VVNFEKSKSRSPLFAGFVKIGLPSVCMTRKAPDLRRLPRLHWS
jgi:hypothetical protein